MPPRDGHRDRAHPPLAVGQEIDSSCGDLRRRGGRLLPMESGLMIPIAPFLAHLVTTGLGPVYDGLTHFLTSPEELVPVLALALLVGLRAPANSRWALFVLPACWLLGGSAGLAARLGFSVAWTAATLVVIGGLVAWNPPLSLTATTCLAALLGFFLGFLDGVGMARPELGVKAVCGSAA